jgi:pentatricopeptide repeat protein
MKKMLRRRIIVELNRAIVRKALINSYRTHFDAVVPPISRKYSVRLLSSISDNVTLANTSFQSIEDRDNVSTTSFAVEASGSFTMAETESTGIPDAAVKRALRNEPDDEWDFIVELQEGAIPEDFAELEDEAESSESTISKNNEMFYDWQWKIIGTARLLEAPVGSWTHEQWFSAENILLNGWPEQHCIRAVVLQFALLRRACYELENTKELEKQLKQEELSTNPSTETYNISVDSAMTPSEADKHVDPVDHTAAVERKFGKKMLSRLVSNWRNVYMIHPEVLRQCHLSPQELLNDVLNLYIGKYEFPVSEKVFRHIVVAESNHREGCKPEFAEQVLSHALDLYDDGMEDCFPTTSLWNYVLLSWVNADRRQASSNGVARIVRLMEELKVQRSRQTYRILFRECLQRGTEQSARDAEGFLRQMYKEFLGDNFRVQPDMSSFIYVADAWAKSKSQLAGPRAEQIYEQMKALRAKNHLLDDFDREVRLVTCVLLSYIGVGNAAAAQKAEEFYRRTGVSPDASTFSALISMYAKNYDIVGAERIWNELISNSSSNSLDTKELEFSASALLDACAKTRIPNRVEKAESIFSWLRSNKSINIDTACYNGKF